LVDNTVINIKNSSFLNLRGYSKKGGGALLILYSQTYERSGKESIFIGNDTSFTNSTSENGGGAIALINPSIVKIDGTKFMLNTAKKMGGAIYFSCIDESLSMPCNVNIERSIFFGNVALIEGGAVKWDFYEPLNLLNLSNVYFNNTANIYGDNIASVSKSIITLSSSYNQSNYTSGNITEI
jgi:predicted outer membrane repeat protein